MLDDDGNGDGNGDDEDDGGNGDGNSDDGGSDGDECGGVAGRGRSRLETINDIVLLVAGCVIHRLKDYIPRLHVGYVY